MLDVCLNFLRDAPTGAQIESPALFLASIGSACVSTYIRKLREYGWDVPGSAWTSFPRFGSFDSDGAGVFRRREAR
jgi:hypothetical protein